jgi:hypothetical protein
VHSTLWECMHTCTLLEHCVSELGGTYAMEDTDSMAIVATERGGPILCPGGPFRADGLEAVNALSWEQVDGISARFSDLNPYDRGAVKGSVLKMEDDNRDPKTDKPRQIYCVAISAKRYALFAQDEKGHPAMLREGLNNKEDRWSEHGLGHLLNPSDPESEDRDWIAQVWLDIVLKALGCATPVRSFEGRPAVGRLTISSPAMMRPLRLLNEGKTYGDQIKPFNFLITCHVKPFGHPPGVNAERFHLIAPYESDAQKWLKMDWIDQYSKDSEKRYHITTEDQHGTRFAVRVKTYADVVREYEVHPESKCADATGNPCDKQTIGLLQRRHIQIDQIKYIGKESNSLEEVESGLGHSEQSVYTEYPDLRRDHWQTKILPILRDKMPPDIVMQISGKSRSVVFEWLAERGRPHPKTQKHIAQALRELGVI